MKVCSILLYNDRNCTRVTGRHQTLAIAMLTQIKSRASKGSETARQMYILLDQDISAIPVVGGSSSSSSLLERKPSESSMSSSCVGF